MAIAQTGSILNPAEPRLSALRVLQPAIEGKSARLGIALHAITGANLLERGDRMPMAASLEFRPCFPDPRLDLTFYLPSSVKLRKGVTKCVIKEVARQYLPDEVVDRTETGFRVPLDAGFRNSPCVMARDLLTGSRFLSLASAWTAVRGS